MYIIPNVMDRMRGASSTGQDRMCAHVCEAVCTRPKMELVLESRTGAVRVGRAGQPENQGGDRGCMGAQRGCVGTGSTNTGECVGGQRAGAGPAWAHEEQS